MSDFLKQGGASLPADYASMLEAMEQKEKTRLKPRNPFPKKVQASFSHVATRDNYDDYLFRCHSFGRLMGGLPKPLTESQAKTYAAYHDRFMGIGRPLTENQEATYYDLGAKMRAKIQLSDGAKTLCEELVREDVFKRRKVIETKYMDKGIEMEDASIKLYGQYIGQELEKNTERKLNDYWVGEADNVQGKVRDFKTSWDHDTFPRAVPKISTLYEWQLQLYMDLWQMDEAELIYTLVDTPIRLVDDELRRMDWKYNLMTMDGCIRPEHIPFVVEKVSNMIYTEAGLVELCEMSGTLDIDWFAAGFMELPIEQRIKVFHTKRNEKMLRQGREMVKLARDYMNKIKN
ncbi:MULTISPECIES: hypothetical protein [unclassified Carboxylicivirga]|uniref:hypothetical protein n=1 Tax=Carboxylicivirga TaxID=1628153 RepID=UPI003D3306B0